MSKSRTRGFSRSERARPRNWRGNRRLRLAALFFCVAFPFSCVLGVDRLLALSQPLVIQWRYDSEQTVNLTPATFGDAVYMPLAAGTLVSLRVTDGQLLWKMDVGGEFSAAPVADEHGVYLASETGLIANNHASQTNGTLRALGRTSGVTIWMQKLPRPLRGHLASSATMLFGGSADGRVYAFRKENGEIQWTMQHSAPFASFPVLSRGRLYIGSEDGALMVLDQTTGKIVWRYRTRGAIRGPVALSNDLVLFGSADGYVYAFNEVTGKLRWRRRTGAGVQAVTSAGQGLIVASLDNFVYFYSLPRGERLWKRQLSGRIAAQPLAASDGVLLAPLAGDACVVLDLRDGKQLNTLPVGEDNNTAASPIMAGETLLVTTRHGLMAFAAPVRQSLTNTAPAPARQ